MNQQVENFARTVEELRRLFRGNNNTLNGYLSKCIFYSGLGSNDYLNNYFMTDYYSTHSQYTPQAYATALLQDYCKQLSVSGFKLIPTKWSHFLIMNKQLMTFLN